MIRSAFTCVVPACASPVHSRGLCLKCYARAQAHVKQGLATWDELVQLGLARPPEAAGPNLFTEALKRARTAAGASQQSTG